jgi:hypothetical protein
LGGFKRYLPLSIALSFVLIHDLGGAGHRAAPVSSAIAPAPIVKATVIPRRRFAPARRDALPAHPAARRPRPIGRPAQAHAPQRVSYPRRVVIAPHRFAAPASPPAQTHLTPTVARSPAAAASTATARAPSEHGSEFGFEN